MKKSNRIVTALLSLCLLTGISNVAMSYEDDNSKRQLAVLMKEEVYQLWHTYLTEENVKGSDPRWEQIKNWSDTVAEAVYYYQYTGENISEERIARLPIHWNTHLMVATIILVESGLKPEAVGKFGEVGLTQLNYHARNGYTKAEITADPELSIFLGTRWLAIQVAECNTSLYNWTDEAWKGPLSSYCAGIATVWKRKKQKCRNITVAKKRIKLMQTYRKLILEQNGKLYYDMLSSGGE